MLNVVGFVLLLLTLFVCLDETKSDFGNKLLVNSSINMNFNCPDCLCIKLDKACDIDCLFSERE